MAKTNHPLPGPTDQGHGGTKGPFPGPTDQGHGPVKGNSPSTPGTGSGPGTSAYDILNNFFSSLGIQYSNEIDQVIKDAIKNGYGPDQIDLIMPELEKTQAFNTRFSGWAQRVKNGYNQISIGDYLNTENQYHRIMQEAGLPAGFYDDPSDFGNFIANNVSPDEIQDRVGMAVKTAQSIDPTMRNLMSRYYGLSTGDVASYFLDQSRAMPVIQRQFNSAGVASWAAKYGLNTDDPSRFEDLVDKGVTIDQASQAYGTVKALNDSVGKASHLYGESYTQTDAENDVFFNNSEKRRKIMANEAAQFGGTSSGSTGSARRQGY